MFQLFEVARDILDISEGDANWRKTQDTQLEKVSEFIVTWPPNVFAISIPQPGGAFILPAFISWQSQTQSLQAKQLIGNRSCLRINETPIYYACPGWIVLLDCWCTILVIVVSGNSLADIVCVQLSQPLYTVFCDHITHIHHVTVCHISLCPISAECHIVTRTTCHLFLLLFLWHCRQILLYFYQHFVC